MRQSKRKDAKKGFTLVELIVVIAIIAVLAGVSVGAYIGITNRAKKTAFETNAKEAYDHYYTSLLTNLEYSDIGSTRSAFTDGTNYMVYDDQGKGTDLGTWDKKTNTFSNDTSHNFIMDVNSVGCRVVLKLNDNPTGTSKYRITDTAGMIDSNDVLFYPTINQDGTLDFMNRETMWSSQVCYYLDGYKAAAAAAGTTYAVTDTLYDSNSMTGGMVYSKYAYNYAVGGSVILYPDVLRSMYSLRYNDSLYLDDAKTMPWGRIFSASKNSTVYLGISTSSLTGAVSFPNVTTTLKFGNLAYIDQYSQFVLSDSSSMFYNSKTPFSSAVNLTFSQYPVKGGTFLALAQSSNKFYSDLSAFNNLETLSFDNCGIQTQYRDNATYIFKDLPVFGDQTTSKAKVGDSDGSMKHPLKKIAMKSTAESVFTLSSPNAFSNLQSLSEISVETTGASTLSNNTFFNCISLSSITMKATGFASWYYPNCLTGATKFDELHSTKETAYVLPLNARFKTGTDFFGNVFGTDLPFDSSVFINISSSDTMGYNQFKNSYGATDFVTSGHVLVDGVQKFAL
jgi:prepilin-type N-terminal cleavage/methylation domain-containing protein